jgi:hypothetical protein
MVKHDRYFSALKFLRLSILTWYVLNLASACSSAPEPPIILGTPLITSQSVYKQSVVVRTIDEIRANDLVSGVPLGGTIINSALLLDQYWRAKVLTSTTKPTLDFSSQSIVAFSFITNDTLSAVTISRVSKEQAIISKCLPPPGSLFVASEVVSVVFSIVNAPLVNTPVFKVEEVKC